MSLKAKVKETLDKISFELKEEIFFKYQDEEEGSKYHFFVFDNFKPEDIPGWTFTGQWKYLESEAYGSFLNKVYSYTEDEETVYVQFQGSYSSYEGELYEDRCQFVVPKEKTVIVWESDVD